MLKCCRDRLCLYSVPEDFGIVPAIVACHILAGFFAVLVLLRAVEGNDTAVALGNGQQLIRRYAFVHVSALDSKLGNDLRTVFARIVVNRANFPHTPVLRKTGKGTGFSHHTAEQQPVLNIMLRVFQEFCFLHRVEPRQAKQQHLQDFQLVVQKPRRVIAVISAAGKKTVDHAIQPLFKVVQEEGKVG